MPAYRPSDGYDGFHDTGRPARSCAAFPDFGKNAPKRAAFANFEPKLEYNDATPDTAGFLKRLA